LRRDHRCPRDRLAAELHHTGLCMEGNAKTDERCK
jgi:hypothetical protein